MMAHIVRCFGDSVKDEKRGNPSYSTDTVHAYEIDECMKQLGKSERYNKELAKITRVKNLPYEWAKVGSAIKAMEQYGRVIPLNRTRKQPQKWNPDL